MHPLVVYWNTKGISMGVYKQSVSFTEAAFAYAKELVEQGDYPNVSAAVSGELARARAAREREKTLLEAEVRRRLQVPTDQWEPVTDLSDFTAGARAFLMDRQTKDPSQA
jgi:Arc/MetJ-type ribon-helix-helix transcriptional regulator